MHGSVDYQINRIFTESGIFKPGTSRHEAKDAAKAALASCGLSATSSRLASLTLLNSYEYARDCKDTWHRLGHYARESLGLRDMTGLNGEHAEAFLMQRVQDGIRYHTWSKEAAHIGKLENALFAFYESLSLPVPETGFGIREACQDAELRLLARETLKHGLKPFGYFEQPAAVLRELCSTPQTDAELIAHIQWEGGARCREACRITKEQLSGAVVDAFTGKERGRIHLTDTKGGKPRTIQISPETYALLEARVRHVPLHMSTNTYAALVRRAAKARDESNTGTHAWRYCFARERYKELTAPTARQSLSHEAAIQQISWEMGHQRANITLLYLR